MVGAIESVTVGVRELEAALAECRDRLRLTVLGDTRASVGLLAAWRRPVHERVRIVEIGSPGQSHGRLRLAQFETPTNAHSMGLPMGPQTMALRCVADTEARWGEERLPVVLTPTPPATLAIATPDLAASERFYLEALGWRRADELAPQAARLFRHASRRAGVAGFSAPGSSGVEVVLAEFDFEDIARAEGAMLPGHAGINLCTCSCEDLDEVEKRLAALSVEPVTRPAHVGLPIGRPGRVMLVRGPADELVELVELAA